MPYTNDGKHRMLDALKGTASGSPITHAGLHTAQPSTGTPAEVPTTGTPVYIRKSLTFETNAGTETPGSLDVSNAPIFDIPAGTTVTHVGYWTAETAGTLMAWADVTDEAFASQGTYTLTDTDMAITG